MKRVISAVLVAVLLFGMLPLQLFARPAYAADADVWDGSVATGFARGDGSQNRPYIIETAEQLAFLAQSVNGGNTYSGKYIHLVSHLDLQSRSWTPIGAVEGTAFAGNFMGNDFEIRNMNVNTERRSGALFGYNKGNIDDVVIVDGIINLTQPDQSGIPLCAYGLLVGLNEGVIKRSTVNGSVSVTVTYVTDMNVGGFCGVNKGELHYCTADVQVDGITQDLVGGLVGHSYGTIYGCSSAGSVKNLRGNTGGLVGLQSEGQIMCSYSTASVYCGGSQGVGGSFAGGLVGWTKASIFKCYSIGDVYAAGDTLAYAGGLVGDAGETAYITNCYSGAGSVKAEVSKVAELSRSYSGKLLGSTSGGTYQNNYVNAVTEISNQYYHSWPEEDGCNTVTREALETSTSPTCTVETGTFRYGSDDPMAKAGFYDAATGSGMDWRSTGLDPILIKDQWSSLTVRYLENGAVFNTVHMDVQSGQSISIASPTVAGLVADQSVVQMAVYDNEVVDVNYTVPMHGVTILCMDPNGRQLRTYTEQRQEGTSYSIRVPDITGYMPDNAYVSGTMDSDGVTHTVIYRPNLHNVVIHYRYEDGTKAAPDFRATRYYDEVLSQESPVLLGYKTDPQNETVTVPAYSGDFETTVTYMAMEKEGYTIVTRQGGNPMAGVAVTFDGVTKYTDSRGYATFTYTPGTEKVSLQLQKEGYANALYKTAREYTLKTELGVDYFTLKIDTQDNPNYAVAGVSCYGNDIEKDYGVINTKYNGDIPVVVKGTVPENDRITKICLVQEVDEAEVGDDDTTVSGGSSGKVRKILQSAYPWEEAMTSDGTCTFTLLGTQFSYSDKKEYPIYAYMYTAEGSEPVVQKLQIHLIQLPLNVSFEGLFNKIEADDINLSALGLDFLKDVKLSFELGEKFKSKCPLNFEIKNNEIYIALNMEDEFKEEMKKIDAKGVKELEKAEKRANKYFENMAKKLDKKFKGNKLFNTKSKASFSLEAEMAGVLAITVYEDGKTKVQSSARLAVEAKASWTTDFWVVFVPITVSVQIGGKGEVEITNFGFDFSKKEIVWPSLGLSMTSTINLSAGIGNRFASAGAFGRLSLGTKLMLGEETYFDALILNGEAGFYAKLDLGLFSLYGETAWTFLDKTIRFAPRSQVKALDAPRKDGAIGTYQGLPVYDIANYGLAEVAAAAEELPPVDSGWTLFNGNVGVEDVLDTASVKVANYDYSRSMVFYFAKDPALDEANGKSLYYSLTGGKMDAWTPGIKLVEDVTADASYDVAVYGGKIYVALTHANRSFDPLDYESQEDLILDMSLAQDLSVLVCDPQTADPYAEANIFTDITDQLGDLGDGYYDTMPTFGVCGDRLHLSWVKNTATDASVTFCANQSNQIWTAALCDGLWESPRMLLQGVYPVVDMVVTDISGTVGTAVLIDEDGDLYTEDDRNLYVSDNGGRLTHVDCQGSAVSRLQTAVLNDIPTLLWKSGNAVMALNAPAGQPYQFSAEGSQVGDDYIVEQLSSGAYAITWLERNYYWDAFEDDFTRVYCTYGSTAGGWTQPACVATVRKYIMSYDLDGTRMAFCATHMETPEQTGEQQLRTYSKLGGYTFTHSSQKLTKLEENAQYDANGNVEVSVTLRNDGYDYISMVNATFTNKYLEPIAGDDGGSNDDWGRVELTSLYSDGLTGSLLPGVTEEEQDTQSYKEHRTTYELFKKHTIDLNPGEVVTLRKTLTEVTQLGDYFVTATATSDFQADSGTLAGPAGGVGESTVIKDLYPDLSITGEYIIIEDTEYLSLRVENSGDLSADGVLTVYRRDGVDENGKPIETKVCSYEIQSLLKKNVKYYLIRLEKDFFATTNDDFRCAVTCEKETNKDNNEVLIMARKLEGQAGTQKDTLVEAPVLSEYQQTFDKYNGQDIHVDISLGEDVLGYFGCVDANRRNVEHSLVESDDGKLLSLTFPAESLRQLELGEHDFTFYFATPAGYIDAVHTLQVVDNTPILLDGRLELLHEATGESISHARRGMVLEPNLSLLNTDKISWRWLVDNEVVSEEYTLPVVQDYIDKTIVFEVTGVAPYYGTLRAAVMVDKLERSLAQPSVTAEADGKLVRFDSIFFVGDDALEYGWATENDPAAAAWTAENEIVLPDLGTYYLFTRTTGSDVYVDAVSPALEYEVACRHEMVNGLCCRCQLVTVKDAHYRTLAEALEVAGDDYIRLNFALAEDVAITRDTWLDLNGCTLRGDVLIGNDATLYAFDSATSDYEAADRGFIRGEIIQMPGTSYTDGKGNTVTLKPGMLAASMNTPADYGHNYRYLTLREDAQTYSFHRIYLRVESVVLQPCLETAAATESLLNYRTVFKCNEVLAPWVQEYGAVFTGDTTVYADHLADGDALQTGANAKNSRTTGLTATLSTENTLEQNLANSERSPAVCAYIRLKDGTLLTSSTVMLSLRQAVAQAASRTDLTNQQKLALEMMRRVFPEVLSAWDA